MRWLNSKNERGFSLVELMVVVAIIGVLAALALPRFRVFQAKARQAEAKSNLASIVTLEQAYQAENDQYVNFTNAQVCAGTSPIGFSLANCGATGANGPRYSYSVSNATNSTFTAVAISGTGTNNRVMPGCSHADSWQITQDRMLTSPPGMNCTVTP